MTALSVPGVRAGVVASAVVGLVTLTPVAATPPIVAVAPATKPVPVITIAVPPAAGPESGATLVTVGAGPAPVVIRPIREARCIP